MKASLFFRIAAVLLLLFAAAHGFGFTQHDPKWGVDALLASMQSIHFDAGGVNRSYWDFFLAAGYSMDVFFLFSAVLAWELGRQPAETLARMRGITWAFALCYAAITALSCIYLFLPPVIFTGVITVCLAFAAWLSSK